MEEGSGPSLRWKSGCLKFLFETSGHAAALGAKEEGASGSFPSCLPEPQALLSISLCCTQPWPREHR